MLGVIVIVFSSAVEPLSMSLLWLFSIAFLGILLRWAKTRPSHPVRPPSKPNPSRPPKKISAKYKAIQSKKLLLEELRLQCQERRVARLLASSRATEWNDCWNLAAAVYLPLLFLLGMNHFAASHVVWQYLFLGGCVNVLVCWWKSVLYCWGFNQDDFEPGMAVYLVLQFLGDVVVWVVGVSVRGVPV